MLSQLEMEFAQIKYRWRIHSELFGSDEKVELLNRCGGEVFGLTQKLMVYDTLAALCRLCDPPKSVGKENNSIYNQYEKQKCNLSTSDIEEINSCLSSLEDDMSNIKILRNKAMSHNDLGVAEKSIKLPELTYDEIENAFASIVKVLNKIFKVIGNYESVSKFGSGTHGATLSIRCDRIASRARMRGMVKSGNGFGLRFFARGSIRLGR